MTGVFRVFFRTKDNKLNFVAADITVNSILAIAMNTAKDKKGKIYNLVGEERCTISNGWYSIRDLTNIEMRNIPDGFSELTAAVARKFPTKQMIRLPKAAFCVISPLAFKFCFLFYNVIPAALVDALISLKGQKSKQLMKMTRNIHSLFHALRDYDANYTFDNKNMLDVYENMTKDDHTHFPSTMDPSKFYQFAIDTVKGIRIYFLKETEEDLTQARRKLLKLIVLDYLMDFGILFALYFMLRIFINFFNV